MKHFMIIAILVILCTILVYTGLNSIGLLPAEASAQAVSIDRLFNVQFELISFLFSLIMVPFTYSLIVFRRRKGEAGEGAHITGNSSLEFLWTIIPLIIVTFLAYLGAQSLADIRQVDPTAMEVDITAGQWYWNFSYPNYNVASTELYLPVGQQVYLKMQSNDVIHSFWVPEFRVKQDIVPGRTTELRITPLDPGDFVLRCAQLCGASHAYMEAKVHVLSQADFKTWIASQQTTKVTDPVALGKILVQQNGCTTCHSTDGTTQVGPTWLGLAGSRVKLIGGTTVLADANYLTQSITDPNSQIVDGFSAGIMPTTFGERLDKTSIAEIVAYIQSLK